MYLKLIKYVMFFAFNTDNYDVTSFQVKPEFNLE